MISVKFALAGNVKVGKTCLAHTFVNNEFPSGPSRMLQDSHIVNMMVQTKPVSVFICDIGLGDWGDQFYRLRPLSYPITDVYILCFSVSNRPSFSAIWENWYPEIKEHGPPAPIILVGLKKDHRKTKEYTEDEKNQGFTKEMSFISAKEAREMARKIGAFAYIEASSYCKTNVKIVFETAAKALQTKSSKQKKPSKPSLFSSIFSKKGKPKPPESGSAFSPKKENRSSRNLYLQTSFTFQHFLQKSKTEAPESVSENIETKLESQSNDEPKSTTSTQYKTFEKMPEILEAVFKIVLQYLPPILLAKIGEVNKHLLDLSSSDNVWIRHAKELDDAYDHQTSGNPKKFCVDYLAPVWYNDFSIRPEEPLKNYIPYASPNYVFG